MCEIPFSKPVCPVCNENVNRRNLLQLFFSSTDSTNITTSTVTMANAVPANVASAQSGPKSVASTSSSRPIQPQRSTRRRRAMATNVSSAQITSPGSATSSSSRPIQPQRIARRRPTQTQHFNYKQLNCLFCHSIFTTVSDHVVCDSCLHKK